HTTAKTRGVTRIAPWYPRVRSRNRGTLPAVHQNGDLAELAAVYDAAAPGLLRLALHRVRQSATAEDLAQTTFLAAIASVRQ
ncbi:MAG: RNA polymerase sigma factor, partial [Planctomycetota bacterium]